MSDQPILVTGVTGYLASWIVKKLLDKDHTVHGTVRDLKKEEKYIHLLEIEKKGSGTLKLFEADLLEEGSFAKAIEGCEVVIHTASPFKIAGIKDPQNSLIKPALEGTQNVLNQVNKTESVRRVVLTSSVVAIYGDASELKEAGVDAFDETMWNTSSNENHQPYPYSKTLAEREAWQKCEEQDRWSMAVINPGFIMGPSLTPYTQSFSFDLMSAMGNGEYKMGIPELYFGIVDVRDVADAHLKVAFDINITGRHISVNRSLGFIDISKILQQKFGKKYPFPRTYVPKFLFWLLAPSQGFSRKYVKQNVGFPINFNNEKSINKLGASYRPIEDTITDHFQQLIDDNLL